eukprot:TRINITY_DN16645_c0_g2_i1.p1 TRINITY_DN16645_c0_g2~~TRINITY_DN16645_c0_g2_i1.p1  ORF type:complete len:235 (+),score=31.90 TRINITY_DN16645_c0_g2_i1:91-795(+)
MAAAQSLTCAPLAAAPNASLEKTSSEFWGSRRSTLSVPAWTDVRVSSSMPKVEMAISRQKKEQTVSKAKEQLENCSLIASINYKRFTVKQITDLRRRLPESSSLVVMKNSLLEKAIEGTQFEPLKPAMSGMNAFLFVHSDEIPPALKPFRDLQKELKLEDNDFTGAVFEGKFYGPDDMKALETLPSRAEVYSKLLGVMQTPARNVVSTLGAPARELVMTLKAHVQKLEAAEGAQ